MLISDDVVQRVKEENDIIDVLEQYLSFKKNGENYLALCPFHGEKTPSFVASRKRQIFKCFGCGESGNVISFVMKHQNLNFVDAIKLLAKRVGIDIEENSPKNNFNKYYSALRDSAKYFYVNLKKNTEALKYLKNRGLNDVIINKFGLGYSLDSFNLLKDYLLKRGYRINDLLSIGLINEKNAKYYDRFINRIMFPIYDYNGNVIGFGGRSIGDRLPKYLNSKDSVVFKKGNNLYALNFLLKEKRSFESIILVEGYVDCISLHNHGITNVVASLGTALTLNQIKLICKYTNKLYLCFDCDDAGVNAIVRTFDLLKDFINKNILEVFVIRFKGAKDPDEFLNKYGKDAFIDNVNKSESLVDFIFGIYKEKFDIKSSSGKKNYLSSVKGIIDELNLIDKVQYIKKISEALNIREEYVNEYLNKGFRKSEYKEVNLEDKFIEKANIKAEKQLLNLMLKKEYLTYILNNNVEESLFSIDIHKQIFKMIESFKGDEKEIIEYLEKNMKTYEEIKLLVYFKENASLYDNDSITDQIDDFIKVLRKSIIGNFKEKITHIIKEYESSADENKLVEYLSIFNIVSKMDKEGKLSEAIDFIKSFEV